jgi:hypothetical protein
VVVTPQEGRMTIRLVFLILFVNGGPAIVR